MKVLSAKLASQVDHELMSSGGFSLDQLMELAGLSVATAAFKSYPDSKNVLVLVGPGNNGGDGLVAARHLKLWGYQPSVYYPKRTGKPIYTGLVTQLSNLGVPFIDDLKSINQFQLIIDAIFGFSFQAGSIRPPFDSVINAVNETKVPLLCVDIPSGWDVDSGFVQGGVRTPDTLVSLTAPKPVANTLPSTTAQWVGGRFIGEQFADKYGIELGKYEGCDQVAKVQ